MVDLSLSEQGVMERAGKRWFCMEIRPYPIDRTTPRDRRPSDKYAVRLEAGEHSVYFRDGTKVGGGLGLTAFEPMTYEQAKALYPTIDTETVP